MSILLFLSINPTASAVTAHFDRTFNYNQHQ